MVEAEHVLGWWGKQVGMGMQVRAAGPGEVADKCLVAGWPCRHFRAGTAAHLEVLLQGGQEALGQHLLRVCRQPGKEQRIWDA